MFLYGKKVILLMLLLSFFLGFQSPAFAENKVEIWENITQITGDFYFLGGLKSDGTVVVARIVNDYFEKDSDISCWDKFQATVSSWSHVRSISSGGNMLFALLDDGSIRSAGYSPYGEISLPPDWNNIVDIASNGIYTVGLKADGTAEIHTSGNEGWVDQNLVQTIKNLTDIKEITVDRNVYGAYLDFWFNDGTIYSARFSEYANVSFADFSDSGYLTAGVRDDGTVAFWGVDELIVQEATTWTDIVHVVCGDSAIYGVKKDGSVVATGYDKEKNARISSLTNVDRLSNKGILIAIHNDGTISIPNHEVSSSNNLVDYISAGYNGFAGLRADGTVFFETGFDETEIYPTYSEIDFISSGNAGNSSSSLGTQASDKHLVQFVHGGQVQIPGSFRDVSTNEARALHGYFYDYYDTKLDMTISLSEAMALEYPMKESELISSEYQFLKRTQPTATYETISTDEFTLSGYSGSNIYYIYYKLYGGVVYTVNFLYPTANRDSCDRIVEQVIDSFNVRTTGDASRPSLNTPSPTASDMNTIFDETFWFMSSDGGVDFSFHALFHKNGTFTARSCTDGNYYDGTYIYQNGLLKLDFYWFDYYSLNYSFSPNGHGGFSDPGTQPGAGYYLVPLEDTAFYYGFVN